MELAMEFNPKSFDTVIMLYINCVVNGHHIQAFIKRSRRTSLQRLSLGTKMSAGKSNCVVLPTIFNLFPLAVS